MTALADFKEGVIFASIEIDAPAEAVWDAVTDPAQLASWWGSPDTYRTFDWEVDLRPGGKWSSKSARHDGSEQGIVHGEYVEVDKPRRLVFTWLASWDNFAETLIVLELTPTAKGTLFVSIEDESGSVNVVVWHSVRDHCRSALLQSQLLAVHGTWQNVDGVCNLVAHHLEDLTPLLQGLSIHSRDFH